MNIKKALLFIAKSLAISVITFAAAYSYFYFSRNFMLIKYIPIVAVGAVGYVISRRFLTVAIGGSAGLFTFIIPGLFQTDSIAAVILQLIEVFVLFSSGYAIIWLIILLMNKDSSIKKCLTSVVCVIVSLALIISGIVPLMANRHIADSYVKRNYYAGNYVRVSGEFFPYIELYSFEYKNNNGEVLNITTNGIFVWYDSKNPPG